MNSYQVFEKQKNCIFVLFLILLLSFLIRIVFFNGPIGSDEIVYLNRSLDVAHGYWTSANYNGALRYGYNIPTALIISIFGLNMFTANLWPLICSLTEILAIVLFTWKYIGNKAAIFTGLFIAFIPLHVAVSTRLHADPVVSMFLTLSFIYFYKAENESKKSNYFITGILLGCMFWVKELSALTFFAFLIYPICYKKLRFEWIYLFIGGILMVLAHFALMQFISGDPFHAIKTVIGQMKNSFIGANTGEDNPWYYFHYLFLDIKHTWLAPLYALSGLFFLRTLIFTKDNNALKYTFFWLTSLLLVLSFFPVSISPLKFAMKQSNYISLFLAPIAIIAGTTMSVLPNKAAFPLMFLAISGGFALSALEQQDYQVFTANSRALLAFSDSHPEHEIYGSVNNGRIACFYQTLNDKSCEDLKIHDFSEIPAPLPNNVNRDVFAVIDRQTLGWGIHDVKIDKVPACWHEFSTVSPARTGNSHFVIDLILPITKLLSSGLTDKIQALQYPKPAKIYSADIANLWCAQNTP